MNVVNNVVTILKKPEGYVYADFMKPRCFLTLDQLNSLNSYEPVKRNSIDELPTLYYVSKKYYEDTAASLGTNMPAASQIEITDDFLAATIFSVAKQLTSGSVVGKIINTKSYSTGILVGGKQFNLSTVPSEVRGYMVSKEQFDAIQAAILVGPAVDEIQTIQFSAAPTAGMFTLIYDGNETNAIAFNAAASVIQSELHTVGMTSAVVTGSFAAGFTVTISAMGNVSQLAAGTNTLTASAVAVNINIATVQEGN
jgi:hypothetical protein